MIVNKLSQFKNFLFCSPRKIISKLGHGNAPKTTEALQIIFHDVKKVSKFKKIVALEIKNTNKIPSTIGNFHMKLKITLKKYQIST